MGWYCGTEFLWDGDGDVQSDGMKLFWIEDSVSVDLSLNPNVQSNTISVQADISRPTVNLTTDAVFNPLGVAVYPLLRAEKHTPMRITATFNEEVQNFAIGDFTVTNAVTSQFNSSAGNSKCLMTNHIYYDRSYIYCCYIIDC